MNDIRGIEIALNSFETRVDSYVRNLKLDKYEGRTDENEVSEIPKGEVELIENLVINCAKEITGSEPIEGVWELSHPYCSKNEAKTDDWTSQQIEYFKWFKHWLEITRRYLNYLSGYQKEVFEEAITYSQKEDFSNSDKEVLTERLEELFMNLKRLQAGQQIIYDELKEDLENLKELMGLLSKKDWFQLLKGKLLDAGLGTLSSEAFKLIVDSFSDRNLLG